MPVFMASTSMLHIFPHTYAHTVSRDTPSSAHALTFALNFNSNMGGFFFYHDYFCLAPVWNGMRHRAFIAKSPNKQLKSDSATPTIPATTLTKRAYVECQQIPRNLNRIWTANKIEAPFTYGEKPAILWNPLNGIISISFTRKKSLRATSQAVTEPRERDFYIPC